MILVHCSCSLLCTRHADDELCSKDPHDNVAFGSGCLNHGDDTFVEPITGESCVLLVCVMQPNRYEPSTRSFGVCLLHTPFVIQLVYLHCCHRGYGCIIYIKTRSKKGISFSPSSESQNFKL